MKKVFLLFFWIILIPAVFSQIDSRNGFHLPTNGVYRVYVVFAEVLGDPQYYTIGRQDWPFGQFPSNPGGYIDADTTSLQSYISRYYDEISFEKLKVVGDYHPTLIQVTTGDFDSVFRALAAECNAQPGQKITTPRGLIFPDDFDLWESGFGSHPKNKVADGKIDCIMIFWRVNSSLPFNLGMFSADADWPRKNPPYVGIGNKTFISNYGMVYTDAFTTFPHEIAHGLLGGNAFHSGGAGAGIGTYIQDYSGFGILSGANRYMKGYNAWDRYFLGWKNPLHTYPISARNEYMQEVNADLDYNLQTGDSVIYILRDYATTGDAVRVKLPHIPSVLGLYGMEPRGQWIWIENHQLLPDKMEYQVTHSANSQMHPNVPRGIYFNRQVGANSFSYVDGFYTNSISPINKFGKFDFTAYTSSTSISGTAITMGETNEANANPFTGVGLESFHPYDINGNDTIYNKEYYALGKTKFNGVVLGTNYFGFEQYSFLGSVFDAYRQGDKISISTNPSPIECYTYWCSNRDTIRPPNPNPSPADNRKIYLNGLSIRVVQELPNGNGDVNVKICIRWKDYDVKNNVRWCGDIVLKEKVNLLSGYTILLDQGLTPVRPVNPVTINGKKIFADPTVFTCMSGSHFKANSGSVIHLKNNSSLVAESGSVIELDGAHLLVESGSSLIIKAGGTLNLKNASQLTVELGATMTIEPGAAVNN